jgi:hypothetical protein
MSAASPHPTGVAAGATAVTVHQCVGSVTTTTTMVCDPFPATTSGAAIIQCDGSGNGGGASLTCTASGTMSSALPVTINQCNDSANEGGSLVVCTSSMVNNARQGTPPPTSTVSEASNSNSTPLLPLMILVALSGLALGTIVAQRRSIRS